MMNTGIASVRPQQMQMMYNKNVAEALQLIPSNLETNSNTPISKVEITESNVWCFLPCPTKETEKKEILQEMYLHQVLI